jgi:endoglucanase
LADREQALNILSRLGVQPAVAYREAGVASAVELTLKELGVAWEVDEYGNIIARVPGLDADAEPLALVAHMDHPGFEAVSYQGDYLVCDVLGGVPAASFEAGVPLHIILADGKRLPATTAGRHGDDAQRQVLIELGEPAQLELPAAVVFDLPDFQVDGEMIRMRAADDLAGCASILASLSELSAQTPPGDVYGVFTRAEEVGLMGARLLAESGLLSKETLVVSLESSRTLPGAEQGSGPVIRVGDAGMTFNADAESVLVKARETLQLQEGGFRVQRQLMSGGVCEASAFALFGYRTTGIAFPLGNYHNGAPDGTIQAEYIHVEDFLGGVRLIVEAARQMPEKNNIAFKQRLSHVPDDVRERLGRKLA